MKPRASAVLPTPSGPESAITSPRPRHARASARAEPRRRCLVLEDHRVPRGMVRVTVVPLPFFEFELDRAAMRLDELAGQRQAEAERRLAATPASATPVEAVEHARQVLGGDARAIVADADHRLLLVAVGGRARSGPCGRCRRSRCGAHARPIRGAAGRRRRRCPADGEISASSFCAFSAARALAVSTAARHRPATSTRSFSSSTPRVSPVVRSSTSLISFDSRSTDSRIAPT